ncbi:hypothetical protein ACIGFK_30780 [Streptomyces sp. NPDC085524]|uniref:hypothetical protein n=1 Tax=unclassified Streptomyces TaxID=2593676 RepID=UPI0035E35E05
MGFGLYLGIPIAVAALLLVAAGIATLTKGWLLPWQRKHVVRPQLFGWAQLLLAAALSVQLAGLLVVPGPYKSLFSMPGTVMLLFALVMVTRAQRPPRPGRRG